MSLFSELPEPIPQPKNSPANPESQFLFAKVLNGFALIYHFLHKFLMPVLVIYTTSLPTLEKMDPVWLYHLILAIFLHFRWHKTHWFMALMGIGYATVFFQILEGLPLKNWHSVSLWLTALTTLAVLMYGQRVLDLYKGPFAKAFMVLGVFLGFVIYGSFSV